MQLNITDFKITDLDGKDITPSLWHKELANLILHTGKTVDDIEIAKKVNKNGPSEYTKAEIDTLKQCLIQCEIKFFIQDQLINFIEAEGSKQ